MTNKLQPTIHKQFYKIAIFKMVNYKIKIKINKGFAQ